MTLVNVRLACSVALVKAHIVTRYASAHKRFILANALAKAAHLFGIGVKNVSVKVVKQGITIKNTSSCESIVMLKHFAENPELEIE